MHLGIPIRQPPKRVWRSACVPHVGEVLVHGSSVGEVVAHAAHEVREARVGDGLVVEDDQQRRHQVAHALHVARVQVLPHVPETHRSVSLTHVGRIYLPIYVFDFIIIGAHEETIWSSINDNHKEETASSISKPHVHMTLRSLSRLSGVK